MAEIVSPQLSNVEPEPGNKSSAPGAGDGASHRQKDPFFSLTADEGSPGISTSVDSRVLL